MSFIGGGLSLNAGLGGTARFSQTRGRIGGSVQGVNYPSPFFDIAHTYLPITIKAMFRWCRYYFLTNPIINAVVFKMSEYPITDFVIDHPDKEIVNRWTEYFNDHLRYRSFQVECGLDYHTYGNALTALSFPFQKFVICPQCKFSAEARKIRPYWTFTNYEFRLACPKCLYTGPAQAKDFYFKNASGVRLMRWNPEDVEIFYSDVTGDYTYFYNIPNTVRNDALIGKKEAIENIPQIFIQALKQQKGVTFNKDMLFHLKRPTLADQDRGWGIPLLLPVLKDVFYLQIMKKAQECVAPDTLLETDRGLVIAAEIRVGDLVRTHLGRFKRISQLRVRPMIEERGDHAVKISVTGLRHLPSVFSNNHPLWVLSRKDTKEHQRSSAPLSSSDLHEFKWVDAGNVKVGDYIGYPIRRCRETRGVAIAKYVDGEKRLPQYLELDEDLAYIAGWYAGDGSIEAGRVDFSLGPDADGVELQEAIERVFGGTFSVYHSAASKGWTLCASDTLMSEFLARWIPGDASSKRIPEEIATAPDNVVLAFLRGYLEANGYVKDKGYTEETVAICCSNKQLSYQVWSLLISLGCIATISERTSYDTVITKTDDSKQFIKGGRPNFHITVKSRSARRLLALMRGEDAVVVTSGNSGFFINDYFAARVSEVEVVPCPEVISFEVEDDHTFCVPGMATHNSILLEHIVPLRILFPQPGSGTSDPYTSIHLDQWRDHVAMEIARWRLDPNYIPILPLPVGNQTLGGDGRALLLVQEMIAMGEQIINGMQVPLEFIKGGMSYAGTNVSMRMLENQFIGYLSRHKQMANWVLKKIAAYMDWPTATVRFKPFKMADDIQRKAYLFQLNQAGKVSDTTLLADSDLNQEDENETMKRETASRISAMEEQQLALAELQGKQQVISMKMTAKAQQELAESMAAPAAPGEPGGPKDAISAGPMQAMQSPLNDGQDMGMANGPAPGQEAMMGGSSIIAVASSIAAQLLPLDAQSQHLAVQDLRKQSPELADLVVQFLVSMAGQQHQEQQQATNQLGAAGQAAQQVDMTPLPEQRAPRRAAGTV